MSSEKRITEKLTDVSGSGKGWLMLKAESYDSSLRIASLQDSIEGAMHDFQNWIMKHSLKANDIWYADLFKIEGPYIRMYVASLFVEPDNVSIRLEPATGSGILQFWGRKLDISRIIRNMAVQFRRQ